jgi:hypothetical protein
LENTAKIKKDGKITINQVDKQIKREKRQSKRKI